MFSRRSGRSMVARSTVTTVLITFAILVSACVQEEAVPIDPAKPPTTSVPDLADLPDVSHPLQPTEQMKELARQQCLDDPDLVEGYVSAVDPDTNEILVDYSIACVDVGA